MATLLFFNQLFQILSDIQEFRISMCGVWGYDTQCCVTWVLAFCVAFHYMGTNILEGYFLHLMFGR